MALAASRGDGPLTLMERRYRASADGAPALPAWPTERAVHEFFAARPADAVALIALGLGLASPADGAPALLMVQHRMARVEAGTLFPPGLAEFGIDPSRIILVHAPDPAAALQAGLEGTRCRALAAVLVALWGEAPAYDLTASRRLALAAKASGVRVLISRIAATPRPSAAETRWQVQAAPSCMLAARAPGHPAFELTLLRARNGREGLRYRLEWHRDERCFAFQSAGAGECHAAPVRAGGPAPLSVRVDAISVDRPGTKPLREAG